ncbi:MAG TPA: hypothetical protein PKH77_19910 [Anaerolineae bacterium]|nr:hypothetical protein [Anaerolineae bacterium]
MSDLALYLINVTTLADFCQEVEPGNVVRLQLSQRRIGSGVSPIRRCTLSLQGVNAQGQLVWLAENVDITLSPDGHSPWTDRDTALMDIMRERGWETRVALCLTNLGYAVRAGNHVVPTGYEPVYGQFECVAWRKSDPDTDAPAYTLVAVPFPDPAPDRPTSYPDTCPECGTQSWDVTGQQVFKMTEKWDDGDLVDFDFDHSQAYWQGRVTAKCVKCGHQVQFWGRADQTEVGNEPA